MRLARIGTTALCCTFNTLQFTASCEANQPKEKYQAWNRLWQTFKDNQTIPLWDPGLPTQATRFLDRCTSKTEGIKILVPLCGASYDMDYIQQYYKKYADTKIIGVEMSEIAIKYFLQRVTKSDDESFSIEYDGDIPIYRYENYYIIHADIFDESLKDLSILQDIDCIFDKEGLSALPPSKWHLYIALCSYLLNRDGKILLTTWRYNVNQRDIEQRYTTPYSLGFNDQNDVYNLYQTILQDKQIKSELLFSEKWEDSKDAAYFKQKADHLGINGDVYTDIWLKKETNNANPDDIARPIIQTIVDQASASKKPPLPHNNQSNEQKLKNEAENEQKTTILSDANAIPSTSKSKSKSSTNRNIVFHPDHPEKLYDDELSTSTTSQSPQSSPQMNKKSNDPNSKTIKNNNNKTNGVPSMQQMQQNEPKQQQQPVANGSNHPQKQNQNFPKRFEVQVQARVRVGEDLSSQHLTDLPEGSVVTVEEIKDRRARISRPLCGWLSVTSKFGARIILPTNSKYSKIGGKVVFKRPISGQPMLPNNTFPTQAKAPVRVQKPLDGTAPTFTLQTSQAFFNQFFCKDYPQYQAQSSSTTRHIDISPIAQNQPPRNGPYGAYPPMQQGMPPHNGMHPPYPPQNHRYPPHDPRSRYPPHAYGQRPPPHPNHPGHPGAANMRHPHAPPQTNGVHPPRGPHGHPYAPPGHPYGPPQNAQQPPRGPRTNVPSANDKKIENGVSSKGSKVGNEEFVNKVKEIERRIIQHLHQRGYDETHPDYHRYLQKAKELAIQKAGKEREKMMAQHRQRGGSSNAPNGGAPNGTNGQMPPNGQGGNRQISPEDYQQYMRYKKEKERQHAIAEQLRAKKFAEQQQQQQAAAKGASGSKNEKLTSPQNKSGSVKGLIVLRGLPGSGKTTLAKKLAQRSKNARICTEDRYHWSGKEDGVGEYKFQPQLVFLAREWCTKEIRECISNNVNLIILDNHNARISMYEDHIQYAVEHGYRFRIIEFVATASLIDKYRNRSYKKFPREVYVKLLKLWEHDPRTELINPTFGVSDNADNGSKNDGNAMKKEENNSKKSNNANDDDKDDNQTNNEPKKDENDANKNGNKKEENNNQNNGNYGTSPLEQGLNLKDKDGQK